MVSSIASILLFMFCFSFDILADNSSASQANATQVTPVKQSMQDKKLSAIQDAIAKQEIIIADQKKLITDHINSSSSSREIATEQHNLKQMEKYLEKLQKKEAKYLTKVKTSQPQKQSTAAQGLPTINNSQKQDSKRQ